MNVHEFERVIFPLIVLALVLALWVRDRRKVTRLRVQLEAAAQTHLTQTNLLSERTSLDSIKDEFVANVSHELRTPLTSIHGALRLLTATLPDPLDPKAGNLLRIALNNTDRLIRLTNDILDLQRMDGGHAPVNMRRCSLRDLAQTGMDTMSAAAELAQIELLLVAPGQLQPDLAYFDGDADAIVQIVTNLLSNAIKFSPSGSVVRVHVSTRATSVLLRIEDQGRGIPEDKLETIFDRFQQVNPSDATKKKGTGLGLAICRTIVLRHHGTIWAGPNDSRIGTSLWVELPRNGRVTDSQAAPSTALVRPAQASILVCDDDHHVRVVVAEQLRRQGYTVLEADTGQHALEIAADRTLDLLLLDLYMPSMSGWETLRRLRANPATAHLPVIILSVLPRQNSPSPRRILGGGNAPAIQGWVQKPFDAHLLLSEIHRVLNLATTLTRVLFVGAGQALASAVLTELQHPSVTFHHAASYRLATEYCGQFQPDLLILDLALPDGDGYALVAWMRGRPKLRTVPLIVYSGREITESEKTQLRLGPTHFLTKLSTSPEQLGEFALSLGRQTAPAQIPQSLSA